VTVQAPPTLRGRCLPNFSAAHLHRRELPAICTIRVETNQMAEIKNLRLGREVNDGDLARHLVVL
jgi:hypothetical protein